MKQVAICLAVFASPLSIAFFGGQSRFPDGPGRQELVSVCSSCHDAEIVLANLKTPEEWSQTLQNMAQQGAQAPDEEWRLIEQYLDANLALILINKASAAELQLMLDVTPEVAGAIVKYREEKGAFKSADDVKRVSGLDPAKVDARLERFVF